MAASNIMRRMGALERSMARGDTSSLLLLFEPLSREDEAKARDHKRRGVPVLVVQFVEPCHPAPGSPEVIP